MLTRPYTIPHPAAKIVRRLAEQGSPSLRRTGFRGQATDILDLAGLFPLDLNRHVRQ